MAWILQACGDRYGETATDVETSFHFEAHEGIHITAHDIAYHLSKLKSWKAVPRGEAPAIVWESVQPRYCPAGSTTTSANMGEFTPKGPAEMVRC